METIILFLLLFLAMAVLAAWSDLSKIVFKEGWVKNLKWYAAYYFSSVLFWPFHLASVLFIEERKIFGRERIGWWAWVIFSSLLAIRISWLFANSILVVPLAALVSAVLFAISFIWFFVLVGLYNILRKTGDRILDYIFRVPKSTEAVFK